MTLGELRKRLALVPDGYEIVVRILPDEEPNGNCFALGSAVVDYDHVTDEEFVAFDCNQDCDLSATGFLPSRDQEKR